MSNSKPNMAGLRKGGGRTTPNKLTRAYKDILAEAVNELNADKKTSLVTLARSSKNHLAAVYKLGAVIVPLQVTGDKDNPVTINITHDQAGVA